MEIETFQTIVSLVGLVAALIGLVACGYLISLVKQDRVGRGRVAFGIFAGVFTVINLAGLAYHLFHLVL